MPRLSHQPRGMSRAAHHHLQCARSWLLAITAIRLLRRWVRREEAQSTPMPAPGLALTDPA